MSGRVRLAFKRPDLLLRRLTVGSNEFSNISLEEISPYLSGQGWICEAGFSDGVDTKRLLAKFPNQPLFAMEPVKEQYEFFINSLSSVPENLILRNMALSETDGMAEINVAKSGQGIQGMGSSSLLDPREHLNQFPEIDFNRREIVQTMKLSTAAASVGMEKVDLLWLDLQGLEWAVLSSSTEFVSLNVNAIHVEVSRLELYQGMTIYNDFIKGMKLLGFKKVIDRVGTVSGNCLFVNSIY